MEGKAHVFGCRGIGAAIPSVLSPEPQDSDLLPLTDPQ